MSRFVTCTLVSGLLLGSAMEARAIATANNTTSADNPTNHSYSINWDYIYKCNGSSSVAVDHYWLLTAAHVADDGAGTLSINGQTYARQEVVYHPTADLALERYDKPFPGYYPLHDGEIHNGKNGPQRVWDTLIMVGYGYTGTVTAVTFGNGPGGGGVKRWGTNKGTGETTVNANVGGSAGNRSTLCFTTSFVFTDTPYEAGAITHDSGGPVLIERNGEWRIAGISLYLLGTNPSYPGEPTYTGNAMAKISNYRNWITNNIPNFDTDMDGLPDKWETLYGGDATSMNAEQDTDGDGSSNYEEWLADTVPTNASSYFQMGFYTNKTTVAFTSSTNREYRIRYRTDLLNTNESWQTEIDWFVGSASQSVHAVSSTTSNRFYSVNARLR